MNKTDIKLKLGQLEFDDVKVIAFDADDTLWETENTFREAERRWTVLLSEYGEPADLSATLFETEKRNMEDYGFGAMAFTLSLLETAVQVSGGKVSGDQVGEILSIGRELLHNPAVPMPGVKEALAALHSSGRFCLVLLTKGALLDQEHKIGRSGLSGYFDRIEIVSEKTQREYDSLCASLGIKANEFLMVGNSFKSDIEPVVRLGGKGVHIPFRFTWGMELTEEFEHPSIVRLSGISELPALLGIAM